MSTTGAHGARVAGAPFLVGDTTDAKPGGLNYTLCRTNRPAGAKFVVLVGVAFQQ